MKSAPPYQAERVVKMKNDFTLFLFGYSLWSGGALSFFRCKLPHFDVHREAADCGVFLLAGYTPQAA